MRVPVAFSLLLLLAFFPLILGLSGPLPPRQRADHQPYLWRWLAVTGVLFGGSAVLYALRCRRASSRARKQVPGTRGQSPQARQATPVPSAEDIPPPAALPASMSGNRPAPPRARAPRARARGGVVHDHGLFLTRVPAIATITKPSVAPCSTRCCLGL